MRIMEIEDDSIKLVCDVENIIMVGMNKDEKSNDHKYFISIVVKGIEEPYFFWYKTLKMRNSKLNRIVSNMRRNADKI